VEQAMQGIDELEQHVDALLIIANERLRDIYGNLKLSEAFAKADDVLSIAAKSIAEIITVKGYVNVDFADVEGVMRKSGVALMGAAEAAGEGRAITALENAFISPLLESTEIRGASDILLNILYGEQEVTMDEIDLIIESVRERVGRNVNIIWGTGKDNDLGEKLRVAIIATGFNSKRNQIIDNIKEPEKNSTFARKPIFKVEEMPAELEMEIENSMQMEQKARERRSRQEVERKRKVNRPQESTTEGGNIGGVNEVPDTDSWLKRKLGTLFND
jgi:cell division protein FtsZ